MRSRADIMRREVTALEKAFSCIRSVAANKVARAQGKGGASRLDRLLIVRCALCIAICVAHCFCSHIKRHRENEESL